MEHNSKRGRKPNVRENKLTVMHTSKKAKLVIGNDEWIIPKGTNLLVVRAL